MRILLVEDTDDVAEAIVDSFVKRGDAVDRARTCALARDSLTSAPYDLAILDINLPDGLGIDLIGDVRNSQQACPILMLTARLDVNDRVDALDAGADDYLMKPFDLRELQARSRALMRRLSDDRASTIRYGDLEYDAAIPQALVSGVPLQLSRRELAVLEALITNRGRVLSKERLFERVFSFDHEEVGMNAVELYVARLRKKLEGSAVHIKTLRNLGYQLVAGR